MFCTKLLQVDVFSCYLASYSCDVCHRLFYRRLTELAEHQCARGVLGRIVENDTCSFHEFIKRCALTLTKSLNADEAPGPSRRRESPARKRRKLKRKKKWKKKSQTATCTTQKAEMNIIISDSEDDAVCLECSDEEENDDEEHPLLITVTSDGTQSSNDTLDDNAVSRNELTVINTKNKNNKLHKNEKFAEDDCTVSFPSPFSAGRGWPQSPVVIDITSPSINMTKETSKANQSSLLPSDSSNSLTVSSGLTNTVSSTDVENASSGMPVNKPVPLMSIQTTPMCISSTAEQNQGITQPVPLMSIPTKPPNTSSVPLSAMSESVKGSDQPVPLMSIQTKPLATTSSNTLPGVSLAQEMPDMPPNSLPRAFLPADLFSKDEQNSKLFTPAGSSKGNTQKSKTSSLGRSCSRKRAASPENNSQVGFVQKTK